MINQRRPGPFAQDYLCPFSRGNGVAFDVDRGRRDESMFSQLLGHMPGRVGIC